MTNYSISDQGELVQNKIRVRNQFNYSLFIDSFEEHPKGESLTVPDQALSMRQLLTRYTRGQDVPMHEGTYDGEHDLPDLSRLDKMDLLDLQRETTEIITEGQQYLQQKADKKKAQQDQLRTATGEQVSDK